MFSAARDAGMNLVILSVWLSLFTRDSYSEWNGVQASSSWNCGVRDGLDGWSAEPRVQRLHTGKKIKQRLKMKHVEKTNRSEKNQIPQISGRAQTNRREHCLKENISVCDYCLVRCFLTSDDTLCPPWHQRLARQETGLGPQAKHWPDFFNDATINPRERTAF